MSKSPYTLEINLTKTEWAPKHVEEIPQLIGRAFETSVTMKEVEPLIGTDHIQKWPIKEDKDIPVFVAAKSQINEAFAEKVIKFTVPRGLMPKNWKPKQVKILARGNRISKYFGEDTVGSRQVEVSIKLFDCGHFYVKQSLPGSGAAPYQVIFEGRWQHTAKGFDMDYHLRYTGQASKKTDMDGTVSILPPNVQHLLAFCNESDNQLNGLLPAIVGGEQACRVEVYREPDVVEKVAARFNEEDTCSPSTKDTPPAATPKIERAQMSESAIPETRTTSTTASERPRADASLQARCRPVETAIPPRSAGRPANLVDTPAARDDDNGKDDESTWPMAIGIIFFSLIMLLFAWLNWQDGKLDASSEDANEEWFR
eukprot:TRINITY_DN67082_c0_g1_i1.p1 TRINITY_DN67082_c0_g1~~TRINITY_DN67082_c0_g1_i1.p1  ORF type:complete len:393 (+),score=67.28 TRINITY_DN67082_c0_g1_i1:72-1181(+)